MIVNELACKLHLLVLRLYIAGREPVVNNLYPPIEYPVPRGTPSISPYCTWFHGDSDVTEPYNKPLRVSYIEHIFIFQPTSLAVGTLNFKRECLKC